MIHTPAFFSLFRIYLLLFASLSSFSEVFCFAFESFELTVHYSEVFLNSDVLPMLSSMLSKRAATVHIISRNIFVLSNYNNICSAIKRRRTQKRNLDNLCLSFLPKNNSCTALAFALALSLSLSLIFPNALEMKIIKINIIFVIFSSSLLFETMQLKSNYVLFLPVDALVLLCLCVCLLQGKKSFSCSEENDT